MGDCAAAPDGRGLDRARPPAAVVVNRGQDWLCQSCDSDPIMALISRWGVVFGAATRGPAGGSAAKVREKARPRRGLKCHGAALMLPCCGAMFGRRNW